MPSRSNPASPSAQRPAAKFPKRPAAQPRLLIRSSSIHAAGCYTLDPIRRGSHVIEYDGPRLPKKLADERYDGRIVTYLFGFGDAGDVIDGFGAAMFLNHSCAPNCATDERGGRVFIRAIRDIAAGEELVYEYNLYDSEVDEAADCYCGAGHCRGTMYSDEEMKRRSRLLARQSAARNRNSPDRNAPGSNAPGRKAPGRKGRGEKAS